MAKLKLRALDLFSGCGGLTRGLRDAGYSVIGAVEMDKSAAAVYVQNHRRVTLFRTDIRRLSVRYVMNQLKIRRGQLDLLAGCPPCQGFSTLTTRNGHWIVDDPRNGLIREFLRFVRELRPRAVMLENVPALSGELLFETFCGALESLGYSVTWKVLDVADYGVPQRRRRLILLATTMGSPSLAPPVNPRPTVRETIGQLLPAGNSGDSLHDLPERRSGKVQSLIALIPKDGGSRRDLASEHQLECHMRCDGFKDVYGRMSWDAVSPTITSGCFNPSKGRFLHPSEDRCITLREAALLQSFPDTYRFDPKLGKERLALMIGNALPPAFVRRHASELARTLRATTSKTNGQPQSKSTQPLHGRSKNARNLARITPRGRTATSEAEFRKECSGSSGKA